MCSSDKKKFRFIENKKASQLNNKEIKITNVGISIVKDYLN
jgi:hypothetical protein